MVFQETFALHFEISALNGALRRAQNANSVRYWREALVEQALHFLRTLPILAHFEDDVARGEETEKAWQAAHARLTPSWMELPPANDARYLLQIHAEQMPYFGYAYQLAFLLGYLTTFRASSIATLASHGPWSPIEDAARVAFGVDLHDVATFHPIYEHVEALLEKLENGA